MAGRGGGPSRRSHTKSRKGCKTCKRRHIRCDETFPQCRNCTKHHVRCDYMDAPPENEGGLKISVHPGLNWTPEIEGAINTWQSSGVFPFADLELQVVPDIKHLARDEIRLLYHLCITMNELKQSRTSKLSVWTDIMPECLVIAADQPLAMRAVLAFSASIMTWETQSSTARTVASEYISLTMKELREAMSSFSKANADGILTASLILSWLHNDWRVWAHEMSGLKTIIHASQQFRPNTILEGFLSQNWIDPLQNFSGTSNFPVTEQRQRDNSKTIEAIQTSLRRLQMSVVQPDEDQKLIERMDTLMDSFLKAPIAESPKDQFDRLHNLRKMLFWLPVNLLSSRRGDIHSLLVLSHYYATALALETVFPDLGAPFLASLAAAPLVEIINIIQTCQVTQTHDPLAQTAAALIDFPREALAQFQSRREWALQEANIQSHVPQQYNVDPLGYDLASHLTELPSVPSLSPAFSSTTIHLTPPPISAQLPRSPFLEVPGSISEQYAYKSYTPTTPSFHTPTTGYEVSPLISPAFHSDMEGSSYRLPMPNYNERRVSTEFGDLDVTSMEDYTISPASGIYQSSTGSVAGGCVVPTAVWA